MALGHKTNLCSLAACIIALAPILVGGIANTSAHVRNPVKPTIKSDEIPLHCPAQFITSMVPDGCGGVWVAGEDSGIYHGVLNANLAPKAANASQGRVQIHAKWTHFDPVNSPGLVSNHIYSLCVDTKGRLWAGTLRRGICVYNGKKWKHYGILAGPIGSHVVAIANDPRDDSIWMCSESGLSVYMPRGCRTASLLSRLSRFRAPVSRATPIVFGRWRYISQMNGLPANPDCVAFNKQGTAFVGTLCNGLAMARYPYTRWRVIHGPWHLPQTPTGYNLPSNLINCVSVGPRGTVYVGTGLGVAISKNNGESFRYECGADYAAKVIGLWHRPLGFQSPSSAFLNTLLPADHITCLAKDISGHLWIGTWRSGYEVLDPKTNQLYKSMGDLTLKTTDGYISELCPVTVARNTSRDSNHFAGADHRRAKVIRQVMLIGRYGFGVSAFAIGVGRAAGDVENPRLAALWRVEFPRPARVRLSSFNSVLGEIGHVSLAHKSPFVIALPQDWRTQGAWLGRYGKFWADLCAMDSPSDCVWGASPSQVDYYACIGPHHRPGDSMRYWVQWLQTSRARCLEIPPVYMSQLVDIHLASPIQDRREAENDDHGETYSTTWQGPGLFVSVRVPAGLFYLSLYDCNKDGHSGPNRDRDYLVTLKARSASCPVGPVGWTISSPVLARARICNFWRGCYQRFLVRGPMDLAIHVRRNYSFNTILAGVFLDRVNEFPFPYFTWRSRWNHERVDRAREARVTRRRWAVHRARLLRPRPAGWSALASIRLWHNLGRLRYINPAAWAELSPVAYALELRWFTAHPKGVTTRQLARCNYMLLRFHKWEQDVAKLYPMTARQIEKSLKWNHKTANCISGGYQWVEGYQVLLAAKDRGNYGRGYFRKKEQKLEAEAQRMADNMVKQ